MDVWFRDFNPTKTTGFPAFLIGFTAPFSHKRRLLAIT